MSILFFVEQLGLGGVVRQLAMKSDGLVRRGHRVFLLGMYTIDEDWRALWQSEAVALGSLFAAPSTKIPWRAAHLLGATFRLRRVLQEHDVDVLYAYQGQSARLVAWVATRSSQATLVWGVQGSAPQRVRVGGWRRGLPYHLCRSVSGSVPLLIANSEAGRARRRREGFRCRRQIVVADALDADSFKPDAEARAAVRSEWEIADERLIGLVGRISPEKGHRVFLEAAARVAARRRDVRVVLVGDGPRALRRELEQLADELGLADRVLWAGARHDMPAVYNALDVLCSASFREGSPNVVVESLACGTACVVTDVGDAARIVGETGIVVPPGDPRRLAEGLASMLDRLAAIDPLRLREEVVGRFQLERTVDDTERALDDVAHAG